MTVTITPEIQAAFQAYLNEAVDCDVLGTPIPRRDTYPYNTQTGMLGEVTFAAGYQAGEKAGYEAAQPDPYTELRNLEANDG